MAKNKVIEMEYTDGTAMGRIKAFLRENYEEGCICPACNQHVKLYKNPINYTMARALIELYKAGNEFIHLKDYLMNKRIKNSHNFPLLRHWKLIEAKPVDPDSKKGKNSGFYRITQIGKDFVELKRTLPKHCKTYNNQVYGFSMEQITIKEALSTYFDYDDLMNS